MYTLLGYQKIKSNKTGREFFKMYVSYSDCNVEGLATKEIFVPTELVEGGQLLSNIDIDIQLNLDGRITSVKIL